MESTFSPWWSRRWVWSAACALSVAIGVALLALTLISSNVAVAYVLATSIWSVVGLVLWWKRPSHSMGPLLTLTGLTSFAVVPGFLMGAFFVQFEATITQQPWPMVIGLAFSGVYTFMIVLPITLFPEGRATSAPQRVFVVLILTAMAVAGVSGLLSEPLGPAAHPFVPEDVARTAREVFDSMVEVYGFFLLGAYVFKVLDFRRSESVRRKQLEWLVYTLTVYLVFTIVTFGLVGTEGFNLLGLTLDALFTGLIPLAMALAIVRYRLYEIDRLVSRTVTYALVVVIVALVFAIPVILIPSALGQDSDLVVAVATLLAAAVFNPVRRGVQTRVDRRFNRSRYDAGREIERLAQRLNMTPRADPPIPETVDLIAKVFEPSRIGVWVK